jgi:hypothetical protein
MAGRPTVITPEVIKKLEECFALDYTIADACFEAKISQDTYYNWMRQDRIFFERMNFSKGNIARAAKFTLARAVKTNPQSAAWYLERKRKDEGYAPRQELTGAEGTSLGYVHQGDLKGGEVNAIQEHQTKTLPVGEPPRPSPQVDQEVRKQDQT